MLQKDYRDYDLQTSGAICWDVYVYPLPSYAGNSPVQYSPQEGVI